MSKPKIWDHAALLLLVAFFLASCSGEKQANDYFTSLGLNRLAIPRTDVTPGAIIVTNGKDAMLLSNVDHFLQPADQLNSQDNNTDAKSTFSGLLKAMNATEGVDATLAAQAMSNLLPVDVSATIKLDGTVQISQIDVKGEEVDPLALQGLLNDSTKSAALRQELQQQWDVNGYGVYIVYQTFAAQEFTITTTGNTDIAPSLTLNQSTVISKGSASFTITKTTQSTLDVKGNTYYVLAVKAAKVEPHGGDWVLQVFNMPKNTGWGIKGPGDHYGAPIWPGEAPVTIENMPQS